METATTTRMYSQHWNISKTWSTWNRPKTTQHTVRSNGSNHDNWAAGAVRLPGRLEQNHRSDQETDSRRPEKHPPHVKSKRKAPAEPGQDIKLIRTESNGDIARTPLSPLTHSEMRGKAKRTCNRRGPQHWNERIRTSSVRQNERGKPV